MPQPPNDPHQKNLRAGRWSEANCCYAITKNVESRRNILAATEPVQIIMSCLNFQRENDHLRMLAFCIMSDHYHVLFFLLPDITLSDLMRSIGKYTARYMNQHLGLKGQFWQDGFHDHRCRDEDDMIDRLFYIENNPVRAQLVTAADQWPYSSAVADNARWLDRDWYREKR